MKRCDERSVDLLDRGLVGHTPGLREQMPDHGTLSSALPLQQVGIRNCEAMLPQRVHERLRHLAPILDDRARDVEDYELCRHDLSIKETAPGEERVLVSNVQRLWMCHGFRLHHGVELLAREIAQLQSGLPKTAVLHVSRVRHFGGLVVTDLRSESRNQHQ